MNNIEQIEAAFIAAGMDPSLVYGSAEPEIVHNMDEIEPTVEATYRGMDPVFVYRCPEPEPGTEPVTEPEPEIVHNMDEIQTIEPTIEPPTRCSDCRQFCDEFTCDDCQENHTSCDVCDEDILQEDATELDNATTVYPYGGGRRRDCSVFCESCANDYTGECADCDVRFGNDDLHSVGRGYRSVCSDCMSYNYSYCEQCDETSPNDNPCGCSNAEDDSGLIHSYSYKPEPVFFGTPAQMEGYLGVELEVNTEREGEHAREVINQLGEDHVYLKEDGSIGRGFEIVTHPHTMAEQAKLWANFAAPSGMTSSTSGKCGLHVHYSRKGLTQLHINRMVVFMNAPENLGFMEFIAQRPGTSHWAMVKSKTITSRPEERYEALNLCNRSTIEFRIFKGNTKVERIMKCLEFVVATVAWSRDRSYRELGYKNFMGYVSRNGKQYPNLKKFIAEGWKG